MAELPKQTGSKVQGSTMPFSSEVITIMPYMALKRSTAAGLTSLITPALNQVALPHKLLHPGVPGHLLQQMQTIPKLAASPDLIKARTGKRPLLKCTRTRHLPV